ncbi:MAG: hypothetical protein K2F63_00545, partial [Muribaculaceae bacterium]|nr:hypothetical protein [Muribaculaceae bacterium]
MKKIVRYTFLCVLLLLVAAGIFIWNTLSSAYDGLPGRVEIRAGSTAADVRAALEGELGKSYGAKVYRIWK